MELQGMNFSGAAVLSKYWYEHTVLKGEKSPDTLLHQRQTSLRRVLDQFIFEHNDTLIKLPGQLFAKAVTIAWQRGILPTLYKDQLKDIMEKKI